MSTSSSSQAEDPLKGMWTCPSCTYQRTLDRFKCCQVCDALKPGVVVEEEEEEEEMKTMSTTTETKKLGKRNIGNSKTTNSRKKSTTSTSKSAATTKKPTSKTNATALFASPIDVLDDLLATAETRPSTIKSPNGCVIIISGSRYEPAAFEIPLREIAAFTKCKKFTDLTDIDETHIKKFIELAKDGTTCIIVDNAFEIDLNLQEKWFALTKANEIPCFCIVSRKDLVSKGFQGVYSSTQFLDELFPQLAAACKTSSTSQPRSQPAKEIEIINLINDE